MINENVPIRELSKAQQITARNMLNGSIGELEFAYYLKRCGKKFLFCPEESDEREKMRELDAAGIDLLFADRDGGICGADIKNIRDARYGDIEHGNFYFETFEYGGDVRAWAWNFSNNPDANKNFAQKLGFLVYVRGSYSFHVDYSLSYMQNLVLLCQKYGRNPGLFNLDMDVLHRDDISEFLARYKICRNGADKYDAKHKNWTRREDIPKWDAEYRHLRIKPTSSGYEELQCGASTLEITACYDAEENGAVPEQPENLVELFYKLKGVSSFAHQWVPGFTYEKYISSGHATGSFALQGKAGRKWCHSGALSHCELSMNINNHKIINISSYPVLARPMIRRIEKGIIAKGYATKTEAMRRLKISKPDAGRVQRYVLRVIYDYHKPCIAECRKLNIRRRGEWIYTRRVA